MDNAFSFTLSHEEKIYLKGIALKSIENIFNDLAPHDNLPPPLTEKLQTPLGAFVTLKKRGQLRGCIGYLAPSDPLFITVAHMAQAAAFNDTRFKPLSRAELPEIELEISVMGPITPCPDPEKIVPGRHGLIVKRGNRQGLLLPQVPLEWGWNREEFLQHTCNKAGLPPDAWQKPGTEIFWFEAEII